MVRAGKPKATPKLNRHRTVKKDATPKLKCDREIFAHLLARAFRAYGRVLLKFPVLFIVLPLILCAAAVPGMFFMTTVTDFTKLYAKPDAPSLVAQERLLTTSKRGTTFCEKEANTKWDSELVCPEDISANDGDVNCAYLRVHFLAKPGVNLWEDRVFDRVFALERHIHYNFTRRVNGKPVQLKDLCDQNSRGECRIASITQANKELKEQIRDIVPATYPYFLGFWLGHAVANVKTKNGTEQIESVESYLIQWCYDTSKSHEVTDKFDSELSKFLHNDTAKWTKYFTIYVYSMFTAEREQTEEIIHILPIGICIAVALLFFVCVSAVTPSAASSKPWLAVAGFVSTLLAVAAGFGCIGYLGIPFSSIAILSPFLTLGIGLDDMFVLLAGYNAAPVGTSSEKILWTLENTGLSVSITTVINIIVFLLSSIISVPAVKTFTILCAISITFDFVFQLTFFMALMVYCGRLESGGKQPCCCSVKLVDREKAIRKGRTGTCYLICCAKTKLPVKSTQSEKEESNFFRDVYSPVILSIPGKLIIILTYIGYLALSGFYLTKINVGLDSTLLEVQKDRPTPGQMIHEKVFEYNSHLLTIAFTNPNIKYWEPQVQRELDDVFKSIESRTYPAIADRKVRKWWLEKFLEHTNGVNLTTENAFLSTLLNNTGFLSLPESNFYNKDIRFSKRDNSKRIVFSKGFLPVRGCYEINCRLALSDLANEKAIKYSKFGTIIFEKTFPQAEVAEGVLKDTFINCAICIGVVVFVSLIALPNYTAMFYLVTCVCSILLGFFAAFPILTINLDTISYISSLIAIGYCVDFATHFANGFLHSHAETRVGKATDALCELNYAPVQAGGSTIMIMLPLVIINSHVMNTYAYLIIVTVVLAAYHSMLVLPVVFSYLGPIDNNAEEIERPRNFFYIHQPESEVHDERDPRVTEGTLRKVAKDSLALQQLYPTITRTLQPAQIVPHPEIEEPHEFCFECTGGEGPEAQQRWRAHLVQKGRLHSSGEVSTGRRVGGGFYNHERVSTWTRKASPEYREEISTSSPENRGPVITPCRQGHRNHVIREVSTNRRDNRDHVTRQVAPARNEEGPLQYTEEVYTGRREGGSTHNYRTGTVPAAFRLKGSLNV